MPEHVGPLVFGHGLLPGKPAAGGRVGQEVAAAWRETHKDKVTAGHLSCRTLVDAGRGVGRSPMCKLVGR